MKKEDFKKWINKIYEFMPDIPIKNTKRNESLREDISKRLIAESLTDDERADFMDFPMVAESERGPKLFLKISYKSDLIAGSEKMPSSMHLVD